MNADVFSTRTGRVAFQGALGANSHQACLQTLPAMELIPCVDFDLAFEILVSGKADLAVIPIENSSAGRVADMHRLLPEYEVHIIGEHFLPIRHSLVGRAGSRLEDIREVFSHEQALSQCRQYLNSKGMVPQRYSDTAAAAKWIAENGLASQGAICPPLAADIYGLDILDTGINDRPQNTTRFVILSCAPEVPDPQHPAITSLMFRTKSEPASLYKALTSFATLGLNLTKLESYMVGDRFDVAQFYVDLLVHQNTPEFEIALRDLKYFCVDGGVRVMGSYPAHPYRLT